MCAQLITYTLITCNFEAPDRHISFALDLQVSSVSRNINEFTRLAFKANTALTRGRCGGLNSPLHLIQLALSRSLEALLFLTLQTCIVLLFCLFLFGGRAFVLCCIR